MTRRGSILAIFVTALLAACAPQAPARTPAVLPSGATALSIQTTDPATSYAANWACPAALINPVRLLRDGDAVAFEFVDGRPVELVFPRGFSARLLDARAEIVAPDGSVIAREGDELTELVGDTREICEVNGIGYPPAR